MKINFNNKTINIPDGDIAKLKANLDIDTKEAVELWLDDNGYTDNEEAVLLTKKAKEIRRYEKSDEPRKKTTRERKVDTAKKKIIDILASALSGFSNLSVKNEAEISFIDNGTNYTVKLIKHRENKGGKKK